MKIHPTQPNPQTSMPTKRLLSSLGFAACILTTILLLDAFQSAYAQEGLFSGNTSNTSSETEIRAEDCVIEYINKVDIPARAEGSLLKILFREGDLVTKGDKLGVIDDTNAKLTVDLKKAELKEAELVASNDIQLQDAQNTEELAKAEYESMKVLYEQRAIPFWEKEKKRLEAIRQTLRIGLAKNDIKIAKVKFVAKRTELALGEFAVEKHQVTSPATGVIDKRIAQIGQWVQPGSPIATLIQMDKLRVAGDINALANPGKVQPGTRVEVKVYSGDQTMTIEGEIGYVGMEVDIRDQNRFWVEIENKKFGNDWMFKPGMKATVIVK